MIFIFFYVLTGLLVAAFIITKLKALGLFSFIVKQAKEELKIKNQSDEDVAIALSAGLGVVCVAIWPSILVEIFYGE